MIRLSGGNAIKLSYGLLASALLAAGLAVVSLLSPRGPRIDPGPIVVSFAEARVGETFEILVPLTNRGYQPARVLGSLDICSTTGCVTGIGFPRAVSGWQSIELPLKVKVSKAGDVEIKSAIYTDCPESPRVDIVIRGVASQPIASR